MTDSLAQLSWALKRLAQAQGTKLDSLRLQSSFQGLNDIMPPPEVLGGVCNRMGFDKPQWLQQPDAGYCPLLGHSVELGWMVVLQPNAAGVWLVVTPTGKHWVDAETLSKQTALVTIRTLKVSFGVAALFGEKQEGFVGLIYETLRMYRRDIFEACAASVFIGFLALATSMFSMQVYDRVIPTRSEYTLWILASGVLLTITLELAMKFARSKLMDHIVVGFDNRLSRDIFSRLM